MNNTIHLDGSPGFTTGNAVVDKMAIYAPQGNVIPNTWYRSIVKDNGKPNLLAIVILADIVYWYRPMEVRDENTGATIAMRKRFKADLLQRSYAQLSEQFGSSAKDIQRALTYLESIGVVKRVFRTITTEAKQKCFNVMFLELSPNRLYDLTYNSPASQEVAAAVDALPVELMPAPAPKPKRANRQESAAIQATFEDLWALYPTGRKQGKSAALSAFKRAVKAGAVVEDIRAGLMAYNEYIKRTAADIRYIKMGSTWFNQRCWEDDYTIPSATSTPTQSAAVDPRYDYGHLDEEWRKYSL